MSKDCKVDNLSSAVRIALIDKSSFHLKGSFPGPQDTRYEGGHFEAARKKKPTFPLQKIVAKSRCRTITISDTYPLPFYQPNISANCLDILQDAWSSSCSNRPSSFYSPEPNDAQDVHVAKHYASRWASRTEATAQHRRDGRSCDCWFRKGTC